MLQHLPLSPTKTYHPPRDRYRTLVARGPFLDKVFSLRYKSYATEGYIEPNGTERFSDDHDRESNQRSFLTLLENQPIGSIRASTFIPGSPLVPPAMHVFSDEIENYLGLEQPLVEANRFVIDPDFQLRNGVLARFSLFRCIVDSALEAGAQTILAAVREEHVKFYRMLFFEPLPGAPRSYPLLRFRVVLLACRDMRRLQALVWRKTQRL